MVNEGQKVNQRPLRARVGIAMGQQACERVWVKIQAKMLEQTKIRHRRELTVLSGCGPGLAEQQGKLQQEFVGTSFPPLHWPLIA